jgi:hypothetical protein
MKEHIDEMTEVLIDYTKKNHIMASHVILEDYAEQLYNAGYRKQAWISVDERLPEDSMTVITCNAKGEVDADYYAYWGLGFTDKTVTHWMPLPDPTSAMKGE